MLKEGVEAEGAWGLLAKEGLLYSDKLFTEAPSS